jgi:hypothetical protein
MSKRHFPALHCNKGNIRAALRKERSPFGIQNMMVPPSLLHRDKRIVKIEIKKPRVFAYHGR